MPERATGNVSTFLAMVGIQAVISGGQSAIQWFFSEPADPKISARKNGFVVHELQANGQEEPLYGMVDRHIQRNLQQDATPGRYTSGGGKVVRKVLAMNQAAHFPVELPDKTKLNPSWELIEETIQSTRQRAFVLTMPRGQRKYVPQYLDMLQNEAFLQDHLFLHTVVTNNILAGLRWKSKPFEPMPNLGNTILDPTDAALLRAGGALHRFAQPAHAEELERTGKLWRKGILLHSASGSGKSRMVQVMSAELKFHIYMLDLSIIPSDEQLRSLCEQVQPCSIIVMEDIERMVPSFFRAPDRPESQTLDGIGKQGITKSGLLNQLDSVLDAGGGPVIYAITTNLPRTHWQRDLVRPGRIDLILQLPYLTPDTFSRLYLLHREKQPSDMPEEIQAFGLSLSPADLLTPADLIGELEKTADSAAGDAELLAGLKHVIRINQLAAAQCGSESSAKPARTAEDVIQEVSSMQDDPQYMAQVSRLAANAGLIEKLTSAAEAYAGR